MKKHADLIIPENLKNKKLKITNGHPLSDAFLNNYFQLFSVAHLMEFEKIYGKFEQKLNTIGMPPDSFMNLIKDTYTRYQEYKKIDAFSPMDSKGLKYVTDYIKKTVDKVYDSVAKKK